VTKVDSMASVKVLLDGDAKEASVCHQLATILSRQHSEFYGEISAIFKVCRSDLLFSEELHGEPPVEGFQQLSVEMRRAAVEIAA